MEINIPLVGLLLSIISFILGTITPALYHRFFYEGISIQKTIGKRIVTQSDYQMSHGELLFTTVVKIANAQKSTLLLDSIKAVPVKVDNITFEQAEILLKVYDIKTKIEFPGKIKSTEVDFFPDRDFLPLLVKSDEERSIVIGILFKYTPQNSIDAINKFTDEMHRRGLNVAFRINGKYRKYVLDVKRTHSEPFINGYK